MVSSVHVNLALGIIFNAEREYGSKIGDGWISLYNRSKGKPYPGDPFPHHHRPQRNMEEK
jgi:hypothetical protein